MENENLVKWAISLVIGAALIALGVRFHWLLVTFHILICLLLMVVVLLQSGKAADLAGAFGGAGSQTAFGPRGAANFLSRATTWCAIMFMATSMTLVIRQGDLAGSFGSIFERMGSKPAPVQPAQPAPGTPGNPIQVPVPAPGQQPPANQQPSQNPFTNQQTPPGQTPAQAPAQQPPAQQQQQPPQQPKKP